MIVTIKEILNNKDVKKFFYFITICCSIGATLQWLALPSIDHDELEAVRWGATKSWFVDKHPPLVGIISFWWAKLTNFSNLAFFILSKINAILAIFVIYSLNRCFLSIHLALISTAAYASTYAYIVLMGQLDANGMLHALWPLFCLYLWKSVCNDKYHDWLALGAISALTILGKYQSILLLITAFVMILSTKRFRHYLFKLKFLLSLIFFLIILSPHMYGFYKSDYSMVNYVLSRGNNVNDTFTGRMSTLSFIGTQFLTLLFGYFILLWSLRYNLTLKTLQTKIGSLNNKLYYLIFFGLILPLSPILLSLISGITLLGSWGLVSWFLLPTLILYVFGKNNKILKLTPYLYFVPFYLLITSFVIILNNFYPIAKPTPIPFAVQKIEEEWFLKINKNPHTVITNSRPAQGMAFYSISKPQIIYGENPSDFSWILNSKGCTVGPTLIISEQNQAGTKFINKLISDFGKPTFYKSINVEPLRYKLTVTTNLKFQLAGYSKPICFD